MKPRQWLALGGMFAIAFLFTASEQMPAVLLTSIAESFGLGEARAGIMITVYSWTVLLTSIPLMVAASRAPYKGLLLAVVVVFAAGQLLTVAAGSFAMLLLARFVVACAHAIFWAIASIVAVRVVDEEHSSLAVSIVVAGNSTAQMLGLSCGRALGLAAGWRMTFCVIGMGALAVLAVLACVLPRLPAGEPFAVGRLPGLFKNRRLVGLYLCTGLTVGGYFICYSYIEPFLLKVAGLASGTVTALFVVYGGAALAGSLAFAQVGGHRPGVFLTVATGAVAAGVLGLRLAAAGGVVAVAVALAIWGFGAMGFNVAAQAIVIEAADEDAQAVAMAVYSATCNLGSGAGSLLGGAVAARALGSVGLVGGAVVAVALACCCVLVLRPQKLCRL